MAAVPSIGRATRVAAPAAPEADATRELYERYADQIFGYCFHQLGTREEAEDAVQSTFLNAFRGLNRGVVPESEQAWLFKIAHNVCLSRHRSSWRRGRVESPTDFELVEDLAAAPRRRADELIGLQDVLEHMPENQRRAILLREWQGLSYREIASELELSQAAVETLIFRARRSLAQGLETSPAEQRSWRTRVRPSIGLGNLVAALKSLLAGSLGAKAIGTAAVVAVTSVAVAAPVERQLRGGHRPAAHAAPTQVTRPAVAASVASGWPIVNAPARPQRTALAAAGGHHPGAVGAQPSTLLLPPPELTQPPAPPEPPAPAVSDLGNTSPSPPAPAPQTAPPAPQAQPKSGDPKSADNGAARPNATDGKGAVSHSQATSKSDKSHKSGKTDTSNNGDQSSKQAAPAATQQSPSTPATNQPAPPAPTGSSDNGGRADGNRGPADQSGDQSGHNDQSWPSRQDKQAPPPAATPPAVTTTPPPAAPAPPAPVTAAVPVPTPPAASVPPSGHNEDRGHGGGDDSNRQGH